MKILAETNGDILLMDPSTGEHIPAHRPAVITLSPFFVSRVTLGQVVKIEDLPDDASEEAFCEFWKSCDGDRELAIASFLSKEEPAPKQRRGR